MIDTSITIFTDGSGYNNGVGAAADLYHHGRKVLSSQQHLGPSTEHTVYEGELVGILLGLNMLLVVA